MIDRPANVAVQRAAFRRLYEAASLVIPNPWDLGSARYLQSLGFKTLATTGSGHAWPQGCPDSHRLVRRHAPSAARLRVRRG